MNNKNKSKRIIYLASQNKHKLEELSAMLGDGWQAHLASELGDLSWDETGNTFEANAKIKADVVRGHTNACVLADDSGLSVEALDGRPGIHSSRYAGEDGNDSANNVKLINDLKAMNALPAKAHFVCCLFIIDEEGNEYTYTGTCDGQIIKTPQGKNGFGYDPHFLIPDSGKTLAELPSNEKNKISHRKNAIKKWIKDWE
jgi:XTP/dITP diphosphohydrolase